MDEDVAVLLASELVTNAVTHGDHGIDGVKDSDGVKNADRTVDAIAMCVQCQNGELRVEVHDRSPVMPLPVPPSADDDSETGRGLMLVDTLAAEWGFYRTAAGKVVYFIVPLENGPFATGAFDAGPDEAGPFETG